MRANRAGDPGIRFPEIPPQLTTRQVLVMEMVVGSSVADALALDTAAKPRADMADKLPEGRGDLLTKELSQSEAVRARSHSSLPQSQGDVSGDRARGASRT